MESFLVWRKSSSCRSVNQEIRDEIKKRKLSERRTENVDFVGMTALKSSRPSWKAWDIQIGTFYVRRMKTWLHNWNLKSKITGKICWLFSDIVDFDLFTILRWSWRNASLRRSCAILRSNNTKHRKLTLDLNGSSSKNDDRKDSKFGSRFAKPLKRFPEIGCFLARLWSEIHFQGNATSLAAHFQYILRTKCQSFAPSKRFATYVACRMVPLRHHALNQRQIAKVESVNFSNYEM